MQHNKSLICLLVIGLLSFSTLYSLCLVYFTPRDDIKLQLVELIKQERKSIDVAMYMFTDKVIAQALIDAYVRGVKVTAVLDQVSMSERFGKGLLLQKSGITVFVHRTSQVNPFSMPIMHNKFMIFGYNDRYKKSLLWTGSFNCTASASTLHDENVMIVDDMSAITEYQSCFKQLVARLGGAKHVPIEDDVEEMPLLEKVEHVMLEQIETELQKFPECE